MHEIRGGNGELWDLDDPAPEAPAPEPLPARFPLLPVVVSLALVAVHLSIVFGVSLRVARGFALAVGRTWHEPWRLVTSLFLHADVPHVLWNGMSMVVFAVPLLTELGYARTALIYLAAGAGGGIAAVSLAPAGTTIVGSSGAVAGLFGAWVATALSLARRPEPGSRARMRIVGVALLFLPSLFSPVTSTGRPVSIGSHLGGLATGLLIGAVLSRRFRRTPAPRFPEFPS